MAGADGSGPPPRRVPGFGPVPRWALRRAAVPGPGAADVAASGTPPAPTGVADDAGVAASAGRWRDAAGLASAPARPAPAAGRDASDQDGATRQPGRVAVPPFPAWPPPAARRSPLRAAPAGGDATPAAPRTVSPVEAVPHDPVLPSASGLHDERRRPDGRDADDPGGDGWDPGNQDPDDPGTGEHDPHARDSQAHYAGDQDPGGHDSHPHDPHLHEGDDSDPDDAHAADLPPLFRRPERAARLRRSDDLGLRRAMSDRLLPGLVAAMAFLAALALAGVVGAAALAGQWQHGAATVLTVQVPDPALPAQPAAGAAPASRGAAALALLAASPGVAAARMLGAEELAALLRPWLGAGAGALSLPLPAVIELRLGQPPADAPTLSARLARVAPGTLVEGNGAWTDRLAVLARSLQACAAAALLVVAGVAAAVVAVATRAGLSARRDAIGIVHGLGATDGHIAGRFAARATLLATGGGAAGALAALPMLLGLAALAAPFAQAGTGAGTVPAGAEAAAFAGLLPDWLSGLLAGVVSGTALPAALWVALPALPLAAAAIGWATAQLTVRRWLRRLP